MWRTPTATVAAATTSSAQTPDFDANKDGLHETNMPTVVFGENPPEEIQDPWPEAQPRASGSGFPREGSPGPTHNPQRGIRTIQLSS